MEANRPVQNLHIIVTNVRKEILQFQTLFRWEQSILRAFVMSWQNILALQELLPSEWSLVEIQILYCKILGDTYDKVLVVLKVSHFEQIVFFTLTQK